MNSKKDTIYTNDIGNPPDFAFDERVADVFEDMISRSVPGYTQILNLLPVLVEKFSNTSRLHPQRYYDLGCSLGAGMLSIRNGLKNKHAQIIGVDSSQAMINQAEKILSNIENNEQSTFELELAKLQNFVLQPASMILMNFTLQFIPLEQRDKLITKIHNSLEEGGALVLSEKICSDSGQVNDLLTDIHHLYKAEQGYSALEISQKRDAIENVLIPETLEAHKQRLVAAGFTAITPWVRNLQFVSLLAVK